MSGILLLVYALSGAAALLYQVVWQRWLVFTVGLSTISIGIIVSAFLSGLGLGYLGGGRVADRLTPRQALLTFAAVEVGIAVFALASEPLLYRWLPTVGRLGPDAPGLTYLAVLLMLLPPTFLMGASLPVLSRSLQMNTVLSQSGLISRLYFANTLGGAIAAVATAFLLVAQWGLDGAVRIGAGFNLLCAVGGFVLGSRVAPAAPPAARQRTPVDEREPSALWWFGWVAHSFAAGLTGIAWEVLSFRLVENMVKSRAQTFAIILGVFLAGLAFGGLIGDRLRDRLGRHRRTVFLASQTSLYLWLAGSVVLLIHGLEYWPAARAWLESFAAYEPAVSPGLVAANYLLLPALLLFGPALLMGFGFSLSQQLLQTSFAAVGERLGRVQFVNIVGCVVGATLTAQVAIPRVGTSGALRAVSVIGLAYAAVWCAHARRRSVPVAVAIMLVLMVMAIPPQDRLWRVLSGQVQPGLVLYREDASGVSSIRFRNMQSTEAEVFANGLGQSVLPRRLDSSHVLLGAVPTMVHAQPAQVGIIGIGSGGTLWGASARQATTRVVAWEIMASQPSLLASYAARTGETSIAWFLRDSRIDIRHGDGRHALARESDQFDVLEADAMRPSSSYAGNLYSIEFFQLARSRLRPGGLFATWVPTPRVLETVRRVFPHVVFLGELVALGSDAPIDISWPAIQARLRAPAVQAHFSAGGVDIETLMTPVFAQGPAPLAPLEAFDPLKVNTDMHPRDELPSPASILRRLLGG